MTNPIARSLISAEEIIAAYAHLSGETPLPARYGALDYVVIAHFKNGDVAVEEPASFDAAMDMIEDYLFSGAAVDHCIMQREVLGKLVSSKFMR